MMMGVLNQKRQHDPNLTALLLHFDDVNGSPTFTDSSPFNQSILVNAGAPIISTAMSKFSGSSLYLNGSSSLKINNNANLNLINEPFTIEFWVYLMSLPAGDAWFLHKNGTPAQAISINYPARKLVSGFLGSGATSAAALTVGAWHHIANVRETMGGSIKQYLNGANNGTISGFSGSVDNTGNLIIGSWFTGSNAITGYIDEFRIRKEAMYLADFTPPNAPFSY
jgi:hypothetical protein